MICVLQAMRRLRVARGKQVSEASIQSAAIEIVGAEAPAAPGKK